MSTALENSDFGLGLEEPTTPTNGRSRRLTGNTTPRVPASELPRVMKDRADELFEKSRQAIYRHTDRLFAGLMIAQWLAGIVAALVIAPRTWIGSASEVNIHVWAALVMGGLVSSVPVALAVWRPGRRSTRYTIAAGQMLWSSLLIHLTGGRIETHFHVFGSLAFLAFYRDWTVLIPATIVVAIDHFVRGVYYPQSVFGVAVTSQWRWIEHAAWVLFENAFLTASCLRSVKEMRSIAERASELVTVNNQIESLVDERTKELRVSEERFRSISAASPTGIFQTDAHGRCIYTNARWQEISGFTFQQSLGEGWAAAIYPPDREEIVNEWSLSLQRNEGMLWECRVQTPQQEIRWISVRSRPIMDESGGTIGHVGTVEDITEQKAAAEQLIRGAYHDSLTGLPNRAAFLEVLSRSLAHQRRRVGYTFAVLFLDLDRFKTVNDSLGHRIGDKLLMAASERLHACLRPGDMIARLGGDEFTMLLDDISDEFDATLVADRVEKSLAHSFQIDGHTIFIGCSIGITVSNIGYHDPEEIMRDADIAMYRAKSGGRGRYETFDRAMHERAVQRLQMETDLRQAIERKELFLVYQPIVDLTAQKVSGFEALVRWNHSGRGIISPSEFIPLAEETGLILPISQFVLREACRWLVELNRSLQGAEPLSISVNLSGRQFSMPDLAKQIESTLAASELDPKLLKLEITESTIMENADRAAVVLQRLRELGISILVDDFGTGYSSLAYLYKFPLNTLKIDRTFISGEAADRQQIVHAIIALASNLGLDLIAEGVETREQADRLTELGCRYGQGYHFAKPLGAGDVRQFLENFEPPEDGKIVTINPA